MDVVTYKVASTVEASGFEVIPWVQMHKWGTFVFCYHTTLLYMVFFSVFPWFAFDMAWAVAFTPALLLPFLYGFFTPIKKPWLPVFIHKVFRGEYSGKGTKQG